MQPTPQASLGSKRIAPPRAILVVDDDDVLRALLAETLRSRGYTVHEASSGEQALDMIDGLVIDGFLLDIGMDQMDGVELCRHIRSRDPYKVCPIIFLTGEQEGAHLERALEAGGNDFVRKPFDLTLVEARLKGHFERTDHFLELKRTRQLLARYVSEATSRGIERTISTGEPLKAEARDVSICFTDIRGFTALSEELDPFTLFSGLNRHLADQVGQVHAFGGYIDKFSGDGLMAIFEGPGKEIRSCLCALGVLRHAASLDNPIRQLGIGIHTGRVVAGNLGSDERLDYTVVGSAVNLAARLCGAAAPMSAVVSDAVRDAALGDSRLQFHSRREVPVRGLAKPVTVFGLSGAAAALARSGSAGH